MKNINELSIIIPAYNEENRLPKTLQKIIEFIKKSNLKKVEIIVIDDGSNDKTRNIVEKAQKDFSNIRINTLRENKGKGFSVREGIFLAKYEYILFSDADLSTPIDELKKFDNFVKSYDIVIGERTNKKLIKKRQPFYREYLGRLFNKFLKLATGLPYKDTQCGFKLFKKTVARNLFKDLKITRFAFDVEILIKAKEKGFNIKAVPVKWINFEDSKVNAIKDGTKMVLDILKYRLNSLYFILFLLISFTYLFSTLFFAYHEPVIVDEPAHLASGWTYWALNDYRMNTEAAPLNNLISSFPLLFFNLKNYTNSVTWQKKHMISYVNDWIYENNMSSKKIIFIGRIPNILLGLILGIIIFFLLNYLYNTKVALLGYFIYTTHPFLLANIPRTYIDFGFLFFNFITFLVFLKFIHTKKEFYLYIFFVLFSLTFLSKFTSLLNFVFYPLIFLLNWKYLSNWVKNKKLNLIKYFFIFGIIFYIIIIFLYAFHGLFQPLKSSLINDPFISNQDQKFHAAINFFNSNSLISLLSSLPNPLPYPMIKGIGYWIFSSRGHSKTSILPSILNLLIKNPLILMLLFFYSLFIFTKHLLNKNISEKLLFYNLNFLYYFLFYFLISSMMFGNFINPRYYLMVYPFIILFSLYGVSKLNNLIFKIIIILIVIWHLLILLVFFNNFNAFKSLLKYFINYNPITDPYFKDYLIK